MRSRLAMPTALAAALLVAAACGSSSGPTGPSGPPIMTDVNGATLPAGPIGSSVVIAGSNFGSTEGSSQVLFSNGSGGTVPAVIASAGDWSDKFIVTTVPTGAATGNVVVETSKGTSSPITFTVVSGAVFSPSTISWTATSPLPLGRSGLAAAFAALPGASVTRLVYAAGGADSTQAPTSTVYYSTVGATGALGAWGSTLSLPARRAFSGAVVATRGNSRVKGAAYLYVLGGSDSLGSPTTTIYRGSLAANGTVSGWTTERSLPIPLHSMGVVLFNGDLFLFGGSTTGNVPVTAGYRARIDSLGAIGPWSPQAPLPYKASYFGYGQFGRFLYALGGDSATATPSDSVEASATAVDKVVYAGIDLHTGSIDAAGWIGGASSLKKATRKHTAVIAGGNVLVTGGLYNGAKNGATEESYAQLNADGSTGSFNGATGSNTIQSLGGGNLFNHSALGYSDGNGAFHVLILGGDDVNTPGTKHAGVYYY